MKPQFEQVTIPVGESWRLLWRELPELPFLWHYHPEFELTLTLNAQGQRYVGDSLEDFSSGDLVLTGPNQPHTWAATERPDSHQPMLAVVMWFSAAWLHTAARQWPELQGLQSLGERAGRGLKFSDAARAEVEALILELKPTEPALRLPLLLQILMHLSRDAKARPLATHACIPLGDKASERIHKVLQRLHAHPLSTPGVAALGDEAAMSVGAFHRFFKRHTGMTVLDYVAQLRIGQACERLINTNMPVKLVAAEAGYSNLAHFNRQFLARKGMTPRAFRASYRPPAGGA